jgi:hypothetical protein
VAREIGQPPLVGGVPDRLEGEVLDLAAAGAWWDGGRGDSGVAGTAAGAGKRGPWMGRAAGGSRRACKQPAVCRAGALARRRGGMQGARRFRVQWAEHNNVD